MEHRPPLTLSREALVTLLAAAPDGEELPLLVTGHSMEPFLLHHRSVAILRRETTRSPRPGDVLLFVRPDGAPVLHRVLRCLPDGRLLMGGDAQSWEEITAPPRVLARMVRFRRTRRTVSVDAPLYRLAAGLWRRCRL